MSEIIVCELHDQVYDTWLERGQTNLKVTHVDFHCDMRGLLINRSKGIAYFVNETEPDPGNYLGHAIMNGIVTSVRWVHDIHGGRRYDTGVVKYETDLTAHLYHLRNQSKTHREIPLDYKELTFDQWDNNVTGHQLDIDWDAIAAVQYKMPYVRKLMEEFLAREFSSIPETTFIVFSPGYSHPNRDLYREFIERLATKFDADVTHRPTPENIILPDENLPLSNQIKKNIVEGLHRVGIY